MKFSARDKLKGTIVEVKKGATTCQIRCRERRRNRFEHQRGGGRTRMAAGQAAYAVIKSRNAMSGSTSDDNRSAAALALRPAYSHPPPQETAVP
jgi:molybdopterin-binding protein